MDSDKPFGYLDAYEDKEYLSPCFIATTSYKKALLPATNYICGRRGTGKSAITLKLLEDKRYIYKDEVKGHEFYQQLIIELRNQNAADVNKKYLFQCIWKHLIIVAAMNAVIRDLKDSEYAGELSPIYEYLKANKFFNKRSMTLWQKIITSTSNFIRKYKGKSDLSKIILGYLAELLENAQFIDAETALKKHLSKENKCLVVVDTIMDNFERETLFVACVEGLLQAVLELTCKKYSEHLEVKCCIPGEIYRHIKLYEQQKIRDHVVELSWKPKDLIRLVSKRYYYYQLLKDEISKEEFNRVEWDSYKNVKETVWDKFMPSHIVNGRNIKEPTHVYILRHTQHTPRELISILNNILYEHENNGHEKFKDCILSGVHESIMDTVRELLISNQFLIPNLEQIMEKSFSGKLKIMTSKEIFSYLRHSKSLWYLEDNDLIDEDKLLKHLMSIGFFGIVVGEDANNSHVIKCKFSYMSPDILPINKDTKLAIHPVFYERFNIAPVQGKVIYPVRHLGDRWDEIDEVD
ncbi:MAG TPA: hypothetical protein VI298_13850 [Geobacteraceae bacterium]